MEHIRKLAVKKGKSLIKKYPNVVMVGVGTKIVNGKDTGQPAIVFGVSKKLPKDQLSAKALVPAKIKGHDTDVQEVGIIKVLQQTQRIRPAMPGWSVGHFAITAGTIGLKVYDTETNEPLLLSNNHVLANSDAGKVGDAILQPGTYDGGQTATDMIATLLRWINITSASRCSFLRFFKRKAVTLKVDCAVARLVAPDILVDKVAGLVQPTSVLEAQVGMACQKSGRTTGVTEGIVQAIDVTVQVDYGELGILTFEDQVAVTAHSEGGDSGSAILSGESVIGLLFAGSDVITIGNRIQNVFDSLGIGLQPTSVPSPTPILVKVSPDGGQSWLDYVPA